MRGPEQPAEQEPERNALGRNGNLRRELDRGVERARHVGGQLREVVQWFGFGVEVERRMALHARAQRAFEIGGGSPVAGQQIQKRVVLGRASVRSHDAQEQRARAHERFTRGELEFRPGALVSARDVRKRPARAPRARSKAAWYEGVNSAQDRVRTPAIAASLRSRVGRARRYRKANIARIPLGEGARSTYAIQSAFHGAGVAPFATRHAESATSSRYVWRRRPRFLLAYEDRRG
jgi:hypothetical protein